MTSTFVPANPGFEIAVRNRFAHQSLMGLFGAWIVDVAPGRVMIELPLSPRLARQKDLFDDGVISAIAQAAGACAALSVQPNEIDVTTIEYKINFTGAARGPLLQATGAVVRAGKSITVVRIDCASGSAGNLQACAVLQATYLIAPTGETHV
jgi:uncharacterized protein (TIGR00369 family)